MNDVPEATLTFSWEQTRAISVYELPDRDRVASQGFVWERCGARTA